MDFKRVSVIKSNKAALVEDGSLVRYRLSAILYKYGCASSEAILAQLVNLLEQPNELSLQLAHDIGVAPERVHVTGVYGSRVIFVFGPESDRRGNFFSLNCEISKLGPELLRDMEIEVSADAYSGVFSINEEATRRLLRPRILLIGLYHPETFPLPRFHLGISDLAYALRKRWVGRTTLIDMQLSTKLSDVKSLITATQPDIIGISATFGQYDLLVDLLEHLKMSGSACLKVLGGSLSAHLQEQLLDEHGVDFVAVGAGEDTIVGIASYWLGEQEACRIPDVSYNENGKIVATIRSNNRSVDDVIPELDLLPATLAGHGVMQLESSRGCSYACSFCPRSHKGIWAGEHSAIFDTVLPAISRMFNRYPSADRRIFLVDEEFVGYQPDEIALDRCRNLAYSLAYHGFKFETSSRIDQVARPWKDKDWHLSRMRFWSDLKAGGMARCLFGVESGIDSILKRFNKKTTARQNVVALRILSLLDIPIRCTYITFDPLMTESELIDSINFLDRHDILIKRPNDVAVDNYSELYDIAIDDKRSAECTSLAPFYTSISYLAVSMEALLGSPYLKMVEAENLAGPVNTLMGKREARYADRRIGYISNVAQRWVDRNFSLDYTLKSLQKRSGASLFDTINGARVELKKQSHMFIKRAIDTYFLDSQDSDNLVFNHFLDANFQAARPFIESSVFAVIRSLPCNDRAILTAQLERWNSISGWGLINGQCE